MKKSQRKIARFQINIWNEKEASKNAGSQTGARANDSHLLAMCVWSLGEVACQKESKEEKIVKAESQISATGLHPGS